jgi:hypothetical protein
MFSVIGVSGGPIKRSEEDPADSLLTLASERAALQQKIAVPPDHELGADEVRIACSLGPVFADQLTSGRTTRHGFWIQHHQGWLWV